MELSRALRFTTAQGMGPAWGTGPNPPRLALVGAGGKTSALFRLARQLPPPVIATATTHLAASQLSLADQHYFINFPAELDALQESLLSAVTLLTGPFGEDGRTQGLDPLSLDRLKALADGLGAPLLVEADGSRRLPLKAPAEHEPAIPAFADQVVVCAGLSALGHPLDPAWVHRPERFAALSGLQMGEVVTPQALVQALVHPAGGLKNIPPGARRVVLLNQADKPSQQAAAGEMAPDLLLAYSAVLVASLELPAGQEVHAVHEPVAGVVLAAGRASRFGQAKQLVLWQGEPLVRRAARTALAAGLSPVVVVTGAYAGEVGAALQGLDVQMVHNPAWDSGQSSSLRAGLAAVPAETGACLFLLADQPHLPQELIRSLVGAHAAGLPALVAPRVGGRRANPALFDRSTFPALLELSGDTGGRKLFDRPDLFPTAWIDWEDPSLLFDVDTLADYNHLLSEQTGE